MVSPIELPVDMDELRRELDRFWKEQETLQKGRVYVQAHQTPPEGVELHRGVKGGIYYEAGQGQGEEDSPHVGMRFRDPTEGQMTVTHVEDGKAWVTDEYDEEHEMSVEELEQRLSSDPKARNVSRPKEQEKKPVEGKVKYGQELTDEHVVHIEASKWTSTTPKGENNKDKTVIGYVSPGTFDPHEGLSDTRVVMKDTASGLRQELKTKAVYDALEWDQCPETFAYQNGMAMRWVDDSGFGGTSSVGSQYAKTLSPELMQSYVNYCTVASLLGNTDNTPNNFIVDEKAQKIWAIDNEITDMSPLDEHSMRDALFAYEFSAVDAWQTEDDAVDNMIKTSISHMTSRKNQILSGLKKLGYNDHALMEFEERLFVLGDM